MVENFLPDPILEKKNNASKTFICTQCGECCHIREKKNITDKDEQNYFNYMHKHYGIIYLAPLSEITINISPEEKHILEQEAKNKNIDLSIKPKRAIALKSNELLILDYFIDHDICPFFDRKNKLCTVYDKRPLICRSYPLLSSKTLGKCKFKKKNPKMYSYEKIYAKKLDSIVNKQKEIIKTLDINYELVDVNKIKNLKELHILKKVSS